MRDHNVTSLILSGVLTRSDAPPSSVMHIRATRPAVSLVTSSPTDHGGVDVAPEIHTIAKHPASKQ